MKNTASAHTSACDSRSRGCDRCSRPFLGPMYFDATAHKLPDSRKIKNRLVVKFLQGDKREKLHMNRKTLVGKNINKLPTIIQEWIPGINKIYINESLINYRRRLFGRTREYQSRNKVKFLCASNRKILLNVNEGTASQAFSAHEKFQDYLDQLINREQIFW